MTELRTVDANVVIDQEMLSRILRDFHACAGAELAGYTVDDLPQEVPLRVNGQEVPTTMDKAALNGVGQYELVVLRHSPRDADEAHYYVIENDCHEGSDWEPRQSRMEVQGTDHSMSTDTFRVTAP